MRVAIYNHTSEVSGAEISLLLTAGHLREDDPILFAPEGELLDRARAAGLSVMPVESHRARLSRNPLRLIRDLFGMVRSGFRLSAMIRRHGIDLIHANSLRAGIMASLFRWHHRRPVIWHVRDMPPGGFIGWAICYLAGRSADAVIGISQSVLQAFRDNGLDRNLHLVHNGVKVPDMAPGEMAEHRKRIRQQLHTPEGAKVAAIIGQIAPWKRQEDAIRAARLLIDQGYPFYLWIVGEAKFRRENAEYEVMLKGLAEDLGIADRVRFTGFRTDVMEICCAADLLFLCSDNEPFGRVVIESMSVGTPAVATNAGGVPEIIEDGVTGLMYETGRIEELAARAARLLEDEETRIRMGQKAAAAVRQRFTIERTAERVASIYRDVLAGEGSRAHTANAQPRIAIVHDYLNQMGGAERVVGVLHRMFPEAPIYTTIVDRDKLLPELKGADIRTTWMQHIPGIRKHFKLYFWAYPLAMRSMRLKQYDLVVSSSSAYGKGAPVRRDAVHICYCHTPMRFAWDFDGYMEAVPVPKPVKALARLLIGPLKVWDRATSRRVTHFIANSSVVRERIRTHYGREADIVFPPVNVSRFRVNEERVSPDQAYFLVVSRLVSYKRIDLAVQACTVAGKKLVVVGDGPDRPRLERLAGPTVTFTGRLPDEAVEEYMRNCAALLFPGCEDFGITPLEANACGKPVIAYRKGGALDTIVPGLNGLFFEEQTVESLVKALEAFDAGSFDPKRIRQHAEQFDEARFIQEMQRYIHLAAGRKPAVIAYGTALEKGT